MRKVILLLAFLGIAGCQTTQGPTKTATESIISNRSPALISSRYQPGKRKEYVFKEISPSLQKYPIRQFCKTPQKEACFAGVSYQQYVGKKFYYTSEEPVKRGGFGGYGLYEVMLETGETLYHYRKEELGSAHETYIAALTEVEAAQSFQEEPIVDGSSITLTKIKRSSGKYGRTYGLNTGGTISESQLNAIRKLSAEFGNKKAQIADQLIDFQIKYDKIEDRFLIRPFPYEIPDTYLTGYIIYKNNDGPKLRLKARYKANDWLFINKITIVADDFRLENNQVRFERDHTGGTIWEWMDVSATKGTFYNALVAIANASSATIRFYGAQYYKDFDIPEKQRKITSNMLELFENLKGH